MKQVIILRLLEELRDVVLLLYRKLDPSSHNDLDQIIQRIDQIISEIKKTDLEDFQNTKIIESFEILKAMIANLLSQLLIDIFKNLH